MAVAGCRYSTRQSVLPPKRLPRVCVLCGCCGGSSSCCCYIRPSAARLLRAVASWLRAGDTTGLLPRRAATTAHASRSCHRRQKALAAVCAMRVLRQRANGAARCNAVALVLMQAGRVSPARTRTAAESTTSPIVAAVSTDIDGNGSRLNGRPTDTAHANRSRHRKGLPCVICGAVGVGVAVAGCRYSTRQSVLPPKRLPRVCVLCGCCGSSSSCCCYIRPSAARLLLSLIHI